jgi:hypothetical protein
MQNFQIKINKTHGKYIVGLGKKSPPNQKILIQNYP